MSGYIQLGISYSIPELLIKVIEISKPYVNYKKNGEISSYGVDAHLLELGLSKNIKSSDLYVLRGKLEDTFRIWELRYKKHLDSIHKERQVDSVEEMNIKAQRKIDELNNILSFTLNINDAVDWEALKRKDAFHIKPSSLYLNTSIPGFITFNFYGRPESLRKKEIPQQPIFEEVKKEYGLLIRLFLKSKIEKEYNNRLELWEKEKNEIEKINIDRRMEFELCKSKFDSEKNKFESGKLKENEALELMKDRYSNKEQKTLEDYCDLVLTHSIYPDYFPQNWCLEYREDSHMILIEYELPNPSQLPTVASYSYVKARDEIKEKFIPESEKKKMYDNIIYQICIRTIHELFEADVVNAIEIVTFNGLVTNINPATGITETKTILSVSAKKEEFVKYDLRNVDPKATFKHMKGVAASTLIDLTPIPPIIKMDRTDKRFIEGESVMPNVNEGTNLAAIDWKDFEYLIRELFEKEFSVNGGEVKVTQASSDGGVDAIAFDPDPIRGGKIVIQAKRYTNTVGVSAVRDLYGTVMNEGATKGILVTTSDYGKDSYNFVQNKPITLLNGSNLLALLEKHGHKARINIAEAKKML